MNLKNKILAVVGLGYVGLPLAVEFCKNQAVIGFDVNEQRIRELRSGRDHTLEISGSDLRNSKQLTFTSQVEDLKAAEVFIVTVPTPVDSANRPDFSALIQASETIGSILKPGGVVIYESTVYPGATEEICVPILERTSGLRYLVGSSKESGCQISSNQVMVDFESDFQMGFYVGYSPERINPGDKTRRLPNIKKITSGSTPAIAKAIDELYSQIIVAGTYMVSSIKVAEAAKVIENAQRDINIAFMNELSLIFSRMNIDTNEVLDAAATKWNFLPFRPGLVGGHCIGVDPYYLTHKAEELGYRSEVILAGRRINDNMSRYAAQNVIRLMINNGINLSQAKVAILGISFKENCPDVRNSKVIDMIQEFELWGINVEVFDPIADPLDVNTTYGLKLGEIKNITCFDALVFAVAHQDFIQFTAESLRNMCCNQQNPVIADLKGIFKISHLESKGFSVFRL